MKNLIFYTCFLFFYFNSIAQQKLQEVNAILHDESYIAVYDRLPENGANEQVRIQLHLSYVEQLLRSVNTINLNKDQHAKRFYVLDLLHKYWVAGNFPSNRDYPGERKPCFIDADGNICAVGYLVEQTKGRELAEAINTKYKYEFLLDMKEPAIEEWANEFGLTLEECAMIQPTYGPPPPAETSYADIKTSYGISSGIIGGSNIAINVANFSNRLKSKPALSYIGLVTGTGQLIMGIASVKSTSFQPVINGGETYTSYKAQNNLSYANIAMGTTTIISSALNLAMKKKNKEKRNAFNLYSYPNYTNTVSMGLSLTRKI